MNDRPAGSENRRIRRMFRLRQTFFCISVPPLFCWFGRFRRALTQSTAASRLRFFTTSAGCSPHSSRSWPAAV